MRYALSNRQRKELRNGKVLRIALPYPDRGIPDAHGAIVHHDLTIDDGADDETVLTAWAIDHLDIGVECDITHAELQLVPVCWLRGGEGLGGVIGQVVSASTARERVSHGAKASHVWRVLCVVVELATRRAPRADYPTQWPGGELRD